MFYSLFFYLFLSSSLCDPFGICYVFFSGHYVWISFPFSVWNTLKLDSVYLFLRALPLISVTAWHFVKLVFFVGNISCFFMLIHVVVICWWVFQLMLFFFNGRMLVRLAGFQIWRVKSFLLLLMRFATNIFHRECFLFIEYVLHWHYWLLSFWLLGREWLLQK